MKLRRVVGAGLLLLWGAASAPLRATLPQSFSAELRAIAAEVERSQSLKQSGRSEEALSVLQAAVMRLNLASYGLYAKYNAAWSELLMGLGSPEALRASMEEVRQLLGVTQQAAQCERDLGATGPAALAQLLQSHWSTAYQSDLQMKKQLLAGAILLQNKQEVAELLEQPLEPATTLPAPAAPPPPAAPALGAAATAPQKTSELGSATAWKLLTEGEAAFQQLRSYQCLLIKQERTNGGLPAEQRIRYSFRKPLAVRMEWLDGPHQGRVAVYVEGQNGGQLLVREGRAQGGLSVRLDPHSPIAMRGEHHPINESGIGAVLQTVRENVARGRDAGELGLELLGERTEQGQTLQGFIATFRPGGGGRYYCAKAEVWVDRRSRLPYAITAYDANDQVYERYIFSDLQVDPELSDQLFGL